MQHSLVVYHGIPHLSLICSRYTHSPEGSCPGDIPWYTTRKRCITSMYFYIKIKDNTLSSRKVIRRGHRQLARRYVLLMCATITRFKIRRIGLSVSVKSIFTLSFNSIGSPLLSKGRSITSKKGCKMINSKQTVTPTTTTTNPLHKKLKKIVTQQQTFNTLKSLPEITNFKPFYHYPISAVDYIGNFRTCNKNIHIFYILAQTKELLKRHT